jgi:cation:H+ antiporter
MIATVGDVPIAGFGLGAASLSLAAIAALFLSSGFERQHVWEAVGGPKDSGEVSSNTAPETDRSTGRLISLIVLTAAVILSAGYMISSTADAIATKTGLASGIVGFVLIGLATSLPELSSITAAVRQRRYQMAIGDVFGTNIFNVLLIFVADVIYREGPVLGEAGRFEAVGSILSVILTGIFIVGLLERRDRTLLRMGYDSLAALLAFAAGIYLLAVLPSG